MKRKSIKIFAKEFWFLRKELPTVFRTWRKWIKTVKFLRNTLIRWKMPLKKSDRRERSARKENETMFPSLSVTIDFLSRIVRCLLLEAIGKRFISITRVCLLNRPRSRLLKVLSVMLNSEVPFVEVKVVWSCELWQRSTSKIPNKVYSTPRISKLRNMSNSKVWINAIN